MSKRKKNSGFFLVFGFLIIGIISGCNQQNNGLFQNNNQNLSKNKVETVIKTENKKIDNKEIINTQEINKINKINLMLSNFGYIRKNFKNIEGCNKIKIKDDLDKLEKEICKTSFLIENYFKNQNLDERIKEINLKKHNLTNEELLKILSNFYENLKNNKKIYNLLQQKQFFLGENLTHYFLNIILSNQRPLFLFTNDIPNICKYITFNNTISNYDDCINSFNSYQHLDICKFIKNNNLKESCYKNKIIECKGINNEKDRIFCVYNTLLNTQNDNDLINSIKDKNFKKFVEQVKNNKLILSSKTLKDKENYDISIFKNLTWNLKDKEKCKNLIYSNNKYQCNTFYNVLKNKNNEDYLGKIIFIKKTKNKKISEKKDLNGIIKQLCNLKNIDEIKKSKDFYSLIEIIKKDKSNLNKISKLLYKNCIPKLGYIGTEEFFMNLVWPDNLTIEDKIKIVLNKLNSKEYKQLLNSKSNKNLDYKNSIISLMLYKYKYWKYKGKTFYLNRLTDNLLYKKIIKDINNKLPDEQLLDLINKRFNLNLQTFNKKIILNIILNDLKKNSEKIIEQNKKMILDNIVLHKNLPIDETKKVFNKEILNLNETKNIITDEYLLMYLFPEKIFNDTVRRQNFLNKQGLNGYFIENLFRFFRLKG